MTLGKRIIRFSTVVALLATALTASSAQAHDPTMNLRAHGTAVVDGVLSPGEWDGAAKWNFDANVPGGGTTPATLYAMNDGANLYLAVRHGRPDLFGSVNFAFDNDHDSVVNEEGDDVLILNPFGFYDMFVSSQPPCPPTHTCIGIRDTEVGATSEGSGVLGTTGTHAFLELSHPFDTTDDGHDFSLRFGKRAGFEMFLMMCSRSCANTFSPRHGDIAIISTSTVPPETRITVGPTQGSFSEEQDVEFEFVGSDDVIAPEDLIFECRFENEVFEECGNSVQVSLSEEGRQTFQVRAVDDVGNADPTPESRTWTLDVSPPDAPSITGPRRVKRARAVYRLASVDTLDSAKQLRYRCSVDRRVLRRCAARLVVKLKPGRHVLRAVAVDRAGHVSEMTTMMVFRAKPKKRRAAKR